MYKKVLAEDGYKRNVRSLVRVGFLGPLVCIFNEMWSSSVHVNYISL